MSLGGGGEPHREPDDAPGGSFPARGARRDGRFRLSPLLLLLVALFLALLAVVGLLLWRSLGDNLSGTSVTRDSINSGPEPRVRVTSHAGQVRVEGVEGLDSVEYEVTKYAMGPDPAAAKREASEVPVDLSRQDSTFVLETDGGKGTGADYTLKVPAGGDVEVEAGAGDVEVSGLSGEVKVLAEAGDVTVRGAGNDVSVAAPQGDVAIEDVSTETGQVELDVGSGDVTLHDLIVGTLEASVEAGSVTLSGRFSGSGRIFVETGAITANLPPEDTRELTLETQVGQVMRETPSEDEGTPENKEAS